MNGIPRSQHAGFVIDLTSVYRPVTCDLGAFHFITEIYAAFASNRSSQVVTRSSTNSYADDPTAKTD
jgi:hypothetical protein